MSRATGSYVGIAASILGGFADAPTGFLEAIAELGEPTVVDEAHGITTLVATLRAPDDLVAAFGRPIPDGTVQLAVGPDDRPTGLPVRIEHGSVRSQTEVAFSDWNQPVDIPVPSGDDVDVRDDPDEGSTDGASTDYVATLQRRVDCALDEDPTPFRSGGPGGFPSRTDPNLPGRVEVLVGDTAVAVDSTMPDDERDALVASLAPVDVETLIAAASGRPPGW